MLLKHRIQRSLHIFDLKLGDKEDIGFYIILATDWYASQVMNRSMFRLFWPDSWTLRLDTLNLFHAQWIGVLCGCGLSNVAPTRGYLFFEIEIQTKCVILRDSELKLSNAKGSLVGHQHQNP